MLQLLLKNRLIYTIINLYKFKSLLKKYKGSHSNCIDSIVNLQSTFFNENKIRVLILDFDGVLSSHNSIDINADVFNWIIEIINKGILRKIYIISNNLITDRIVSCNKDFKDIVFVILEFKKPYSYELLSILLIDDIDPKEVLLLDDRMFTGVLAAEIIGVNAFLINKPYVTISLNFTSELFFILLRYIEKKIIKYFI